MQYDYDSFLLILKKILFICFLERGKGRVKVMKGEKYQCEGETLIGCLSHMSQPGTKLKPRPVL